MKKTKLAALVAALLVGGMAGFTFAPHKSTLGQREYNANCAGCHGVKGAGDGPYARLLELRMPDITTLSKLRMGHFPSERVYGIIDGRLYVWAPGPRDMPTWGERYTAEAEQFYTDMPYDPAPPDTAAYTRARIVALTEYVRGLQAH